MFKLNKMLITALFMGSALMFNACKKETPKPEDNQEEFDKVVFNYIKLDPHGDHFHASTDTTKLTYAGGTSNPKQLVLKKGNTYRLLLDVYKNGKIINPEFIEEGEIHQFFFLPSKPDYFSFKYDDPAAGKNPNYSQDINGRHIGFRSQWEILKADGGTFNLRVILRHGLNKAHAAAQDWNSANYQQAGGATDMDITFSVRPE